MRLGAYTACLHDRPLAEALDVLQADGLTSVEVNTGLSSWRIRVWLGSSS